MIRIRIATLKLRFRADSKSRVRGLAGEFRLGATVVVICYELAAAFHLPLFLFFVVWEGVEGGEDEGCGFGEFELAVGFSGGEAQVFEGLFGGGGGGGHGGGDGGCDVDAGVDFGVFGFVGHYETVQAAGFEELIVHPVEESVCPTRCRY